MKPIFKTIFAAAAFFMAAAPSNKAFAEQAEANAEKIFTRNMIGALNRQAADGIPWDMRMVGIGMDGKPDYQFYAARHNTDNKTGRLISEIIAGLPSGAIRYVYEDGYRGPLPLNATHRALIGEITAAANTLLGRSEKTPLSALDPQMLLKSDAIVSSLRERTGDLSWELDRRYGNTSDFNSCVGGGKISFKKAGSIEREWIYYSLAPATPWEIDIRAPYFILEIDPNGEASPATMESVVPNRPELLKKASGFQTAVKETLNRFRTAPHAAPE